MVILIQLAGLCPNRLKALKCPPHRRTPGTKEAQGGRKSLKIGRTFVGDIVFAKASMKDVSIEEK